MKIFQDANVEACPFNRIAYKYTGVIEAPYKEAKEEHLMQLLEKTHPLLKAICPRAVVFMMQAAMFAPNVLAPAILFGALFKGKDQVNKDFEKMPIGQNCCPFGVHRITSSSGSLSKVVCYFITGLPANNTYFLYNQESANAILWKVKFNSSDFDDFKLAWLELTGENFPKQVITNEEMNSDLSDEE